MMRMVSRESISSALAITRIPSAQVRAVMAGYLDIMRNRGNAVEANRISERMADSRDYGVRCHQIVKQAIVLGSLREMMADASEIDDFVETMADDDRDPELMTLRRGLFDMSRRLH